VSTLLDQILPEYQFTERHRVWVDAPPEAALAAAREVSLGDMPIAGLLFRLRGLRTLGHGPLWEQILAGLFVALGEIPGREVAGGTIGQMWKLSGGRVPWIASALEFTNFSLPGYAKAAMSLAADGVDGRTELVTETRVFATDEGARKAFSRYWLVIRLGSGLIRRLWLQAAKKRAEGR
jgi:hypothetical protein